MVLGLGLIREYRNTANLPQAFANKAETCETEESGSMLENAYFYIEITRKLIDMFLFRGI